jgi:hypothetical protein
VGEPAVTEDVAVADAEQERDDVEVRRHGAKRAEYPDANAGRPADRHTPERDRGDRV